MAAVRDTVLFNRVDRVPLGWTWALPSSALKAGAVEKVSLLGRDLVLWRGHDGRAHAFDAYCPHMGAHLGEGRVDGDTLRCFFHGWGFDDGGRVVDVPCAEHPPTASVRAWPCEESLGLIWVWPGPAASAPVPFIPALKDTPVRVRMGNRFEKGCHPNVVMVNAIDEQHFATVHDLFVDLSFDITEHDGVAATYDNRTRVPDDSWFTCAIGRFYEGPLTYRMTYWNGTTGSVTVGPDLWHFHIVFALRPTADGRTEGQTVLVSKRADGPLGWAWNQVALRLSAVVGDYFAKGDTEVFESIRWDFKTPIAADRSIVHFIKHVDRQAAVSWGTWEPVERQPAASVQRA